MRADSQTTNGYHKLAAAQVPGTNSVRYQFTTQTSSNNLAKAMPGGGPPQFAAQRELYSGKSASNGPNANLH